MLSSEQDTFFKANMYENFGDLGMNIKKMVDEFQQKAKSNQNIQTVGTIFYLKKNCRLSRLTCTQNDYERLIWETWISHYLLCRFNPGVNVCKNFI